MATVAAKMPGVQGTGSRRARTIVLVALVAAASWGVGFTSAKLGAEASTAPTSLVTVGHTAHVPAMQHSHGRSLDLDPQRPHGHGGGDVKGG
jgi:hypothetical protein